MEKNLKKDLEHLLIKQTEKIFFDIDPASTVVFSKNIKNHCKDLAKKFLKTQKKLKKQLEEIVTETSIKSTQIDIKDNLTDHTKLVLPAKKSSTVAKKIAPKKSIKVENIVVAKPKRVRKGNNLFNTAAVQKKAKATLVKNINKSTKK
jgi:hypothetical protein